VHAHLYGSPLQSGYGSNTDLYSLANIPKNATLYATWLLEGQTPMLLLAFGASFVRRRPSRAGGGEEPDAFAPARALEAPPSQVPPMEVPPMEVSPMEVPPMEVPLWPVWLLIGLVALVYLPYGVFEAWWYIRFLIPAFPAAFVLVALSLVGAARLLPARARAIALIAATAALVSVSVVRARALHTFDPARDDRRYAQVARAIATSVPAASAFICMQHSGSLHHYLDRPIVRWDLLPPERLDAAIDYLQGKGYRPYILLDIWEAGRFRERFARSSSIGRLDWPPILELRSATPVRLYDPSDRARYMAGAQVRTALVFPPRR
jgi:hypothetical protein